MTPGGCFLHKVGEGVALDFWLGLRKEWERGSNSRQMQKMVVLLSFLSLCPLVLEQRGGEAAHLSVVRHGNGHVRAAILA